MPFKDADKRREYNRRYQKVYYANNSKKRKNAVAIRRKNIRLWFDQHRRKAKCQNCGLSGETCPWLLEYHHRVEGSKTAAVGHLVGNGYSQKRILEEMAKCDILCSNCHRRHHYEEKLEGVTYSDHGKKETIDLDTIEDTTKKFEISKRRLKQKSARRKIRKQRTAERENNLNMPGPSIDEPEHS